MLTDTERKFIRIAISYIIFGGIPQFIIGINILTGAQFLDNMFIHPWVGLLILTLPGILWRRFTLYLALMNEEEDDRKDYIREWSESEPTLFVFMPLFQFHSGCFFLFKMSIIWIVRKIQGKKYESTWWRVNNPYLLVESE